MLHCRMKVERLEMAIWTVAGWAVTMPAAGAIGGTCQYLHIVPEVQDYIAKSRYSGGVPVHQPLHRINTPSSVKTSVLQSRQSVSASRLASSGSRTAPVLATALAESRQIIS